MQEPVLALAKIISNLGLIAEIAQQLDLSSGEAQGFFEHF